MLRLSRMHSVTKHASFEELRDEWGPLVAQSGARGPFLSWEWQSLWWETFAAGQQLRLLAVRQGDALLGIAPFAVDNGRLTFACGSEVSDFLDIVARRGHEEAVAAAVVDFLETEDWGEIELCCMHPDSTTVRCFPSLLAHQGLNVTTPRRDVSPVSDLPGDWPSYLAGLSKKDRHELRRKQRRLADSGDCRSYVLVNEEIGAVEVQDFLDLHRLSAPCKAAFMDERMEGFFRQVFARFGGEGYLRLYFTEVDGKRVSSAICFDPGDELLLYNSGYDPAYSRLSVGLLLKAFCLQDAIALGRRRFDFLRGDERYKYDLGARDVPVLGLHAGRRS